MERFEDIEPPVAASSSGEFEAGSGGGGGMRERRCWQCGSLYRTALEFCPVDGAQLVDVSLDEGSDPLIGQVIGSRYTIRSRIGEGGMGTVYEAWDPRHEREVAMKVLKNDYLRDETIRRRFMDEARIVSSLNHPNIVKLYDFGQMVHGNVYMVMERLRGESLAERLSRRFLTYREILEIVEPVCEALALSHGKGVIHRDLKPENIFITRDDEGRDGSIRLIDFGVAKLTQRQTLTRNGTLWGTPAYMSPEQARGVTVNASCDTYSVAVILFELIGGALPFHATTPMGYAVKHINISPRPLRSIPGLESPPRELDTLILKALSKQSEDRPATMDDFLADLRGALRDYMSPEMLERTPAHEVDVEGLKRWIQEGDQEEQVDASQLIRVREIISAKDDSLPGLPSPSLPAPAHSWNRAMVSDGFVTHHPVEVQPPRRRMWPALLVAGLVLGVAMVLFFWVPGASDSDPDAQAAQEEEVQAGGEAPSWKVKRDERGRSGREAKLFADTYAYGLAQRLKYKARQIKKARRR